MEENRITTEGCSVVIQRGVSRHVSSLYLTSKQELGADNLVVSRQVTCALSVGKQQFLR